MQNEISLESDRNDHLKNLFILINEGKWQRAAKILLDLNPFEVSDELLKKLNKHRGKLVDAAIELINKLDSKANKVAMYNDIKDGKNVLGYMIKQPRNSLWYEFTLKTMTASQKKIKRELDALTSKPLEAKFKLRSKPKPK